MDNLIENSGGIDIEKLTEYFGEEIVDTNDHFENYRKNIVTVVAYLIGVSDEKFAEDGVFDHEEYEKLKKNENATIIRYLCILRTQFFRSYSRIEQARKYEMKLLEDMTEELDVEGIKYLRRHDIEINVPNAKSPTVNIAYINQYILDNIDKIKNLIPDWVKFQYIKGMFLMSGGYSGHNGASIKKNYNGIYSVIKEIGNSYVANRNNYPFRKYITWPRKPKEEDGNILYNDLKFLRILYAANHDKFEAGRYVVDAKVDTKEGVYKFLDEAINVAIFVDCENVDPYAFGSAILNLDKDELSKIKKIVLYDDVNTSTAWDYITNIMHIPVVKKDIKRVLDNKSLVDITMTAGVCEEYYRNGVESIILASSDSDFWGLIQQLPDARFLVLNEYAKTSGAIIAQLDKNNISHCYMSDFAQDKVQQFKSDVLFLGLNERVKHFNSTGEFQTLDVETLLHELFYDAMINGAEGQVKKEKDAFFNKYLRNGLLLKPVMENDRLVLKLELYKK